MIVKVYEEAQINQNRPKGIIVFKYDSQDAPDRLVRSYYSKPKLLLVLLKALWMVLVGKNGIFRTSRRNRKLTRRVL